MENQIIETTPVWPFLLVIIILAIALAWFAWRYWILRQETPLPKEKEPIGNVKIQKLKDQLKEYETVFNKLNPIVERFVTLRDGMKNIAEKQSAQEKIESLHYLMETVKLWDKELSDKDGKELLNSIFDISEELTSAEDTIDCLHKQIQRFYGQLRIVDLDEFTERQIRSDFLELSMMMMDVLESINNPNYIEAHQGVNVKLLKEQISFNEAVSMTSPVTYLDIETSPWAQKLFKSIEKWAGTSQQPLIEQRPYLLNGMRFEFNQQ